MLYGAAMSEFPRYAIYYVPDADSALSRFGAEILGYDPFTGNDVLVPGDLIMQAPDWPALIKDPRKYGFHATLKAPFPLAPGSHRSRPDRGLRRLRPDAPRHPENLAGGSYHQRLHGCRAGCALH